MISKPPTHWVQQSGPNSFFTIWHPPSWKAVLDDGTLSLFAPDSIGLLTISCFWNDQELNEVSAELIDLGRLFPHRRRVRRLPQSASSPFVMGFDGESPFGPPVKWWQRLFKSRIWRRWRVWGGKHQAVHTLALFLHSPVHDPETDTVVNMILQTLSFASPLPVPPEIFSQQVLDLARRKFPLLECSPAPDFQLRVGQFRVNLFNFYRSYLKSPDQFEAIVLPALTTVVQVQGAGKTPTDPQFEDVRERIMPMLYPEDVWRERFPNFFGEPWVGGMVILYVVDEAQAYWYIRHDLLDSWGIDSDALRTLALQNLNRYFDHQPMEFTLAGEERGPRLLIPSRPDAYNASRLLSEEFDNRLRAVLGGDFAVGTPSRDFFVAVSLDSVDTVAHVGSKVTEDFRQMDHPLSDRMLLVTRDGVTEYCPWD